MLAVKASENVVRLLPPLIVKEKEIDEAISIIEKVCEKLKMNYIFRFIFNS